MRKLASVAISFTAAVFIAVYLAPQEVLLYAAILCAAAGCGVWAICKVVDSSAAAGEGKCPFRGYGHWKLHLIPIIAGLVAGFLWTWGHDAVFFTPARVLDGTTREISATVSDWPRATDYGAAIQINVHLGGTPDVKTLLYTTRDYLTLKPGDQISGSVQLYRSDLRDGVREEYNRAQGIYLIAHVEGELTVAVAEAIPIRYWPLAVSKAVKDSVARIFPSDTAGFMTALLTGDKAGLSNALYGAFQRTGVAHVVAVSGLHVSFFAGLLTTLFGKGRRSSAGIIIGILFFFAAVAGFSPSVLRAVFLQSALLIAPLLGRENDGVTSLSTVCMLLLMWNPHAAASVSLQLSFAAVAGIYAITGPLYDRWTVGLKKKWRHKVIRFVAGNFSTTLGALMFTTPLFAYYFGTVSLIAPVANLLTLWAVSDAFMGGLFAAALGIFLSRAGKILAWAVAWPLRYVQWVALLLAKLPFAAVPAKGYFGLWLGFVYLLLLVWILWRGERKRIRVAVAACAMVFCVALLLNFFSLRSGDLQVNVLDVGQGASILLISQGKTALVDCGGNGARNAGDIAADAVQSMGKGRLDYLILTHFHSDHANGVERLLARLEVTTLFVPDAQPDEPLRTELLALAGRKGTQVRFLKEDEKVRLGETELTVYAPLGDGGANEEGLSVLATCGGFDALMTGDMNATVERRLVKYGNLPDIELLVAGHHGSAYSSSEELLLAVKPEYAVISVGENKYGHPALEAIERLAAVGCSIFRTDLMGAVRITASMGGS